MEDVNEDIEDCVISSSNSEHEGDVSSQSIDTKIVVSPDKGSIHHKSALYPFIATSFKKSTSSDPRKSAERERAKTSATKWEDKNFVHYTQPAPLPFLPHNNDKELSLIHICRCRRYAVCRSRWSPYH
eukprot:TRINITY_DN12986_c0_g1_i1.p1 TRINITY_DN12986_c0_g1~~TRINITY_DN12986_c0_g1_i1.p1  ORF type:complete len:128 (-),score=17.93 TRINITY_DN12986_c0_g1_i1:9-392(-)